MTNRNTEPSQGDGGNHQAPPDHLRSRGGGNKVYKSGPLFISSKGIGWTSWKKRWFILTRTSLVFFRNDPSAIPQKGSEVNLTLGGIDLNNSGSVIVKADKKLLTVLFPDGRAFTLKAETSEDLYEWKTALEEALALAPSAALVMGQNGIFKNDQADAADEQLKDRQPVKSLVIGRPILLALEDIDGTPSFLEKALRFIEEHGIKVEGILRQAADVDDVECRVQEYEQGKSEFSPGEDPHVVADCVKYILRELPSSPVPASCCNALLEAYRTERGMRLTAMRFAICETFPEPNRRLLQRILMMMQTVASHKAQNRMSSSAVAACMAPLLLRPLLAGECELENDFDVGGDGSVQLLQAAAAANHAQAIVICLLEEYGNIFGEGSVSPELYSDSEESEELTEDDESFEGDGDDDMTEDSDADVDEDYEHASSGTCGEVGGTRDTDLYNDKGSEASETLEVDKVLDANRLSSSSPQTSLPHHNNVQRSESFQNQSNDTSRLQSNVSCELLGDDPVETSLVLKISEKNPSIKKSATISSGPANNVRRPTVWGRTPGRRNLSTESINFPIEDEDEIQRLEVTKTDLQNRIADEAKGNVKLQESLERRKKSLQERRLALEQDVARLQEQLHKERELRTVVESGLKISQVALPVSSTTDEKAMDDVVNFKQKADNLGALLNQQSEQTFGFVHDMCKQPQQTVTYHGKVMTKQDSEANAIPIIDGSTKSKQDNHLDKYDSDREMKQDPPLPSKLLVQNQQSDPSHSYKSSGAPGTSSAVESAIGSHALNNSKKLGSRGEGGNSTTSALSKLSNRLNFLKERRSQIANELQNMDRDQSSGQPIQNLERGRGSESRQSLQNIDTCQGSSGQPSEGLMVQNMDQEQSDCLSVPNLDRGKSESIPNVRKGRGSEGQSLMSPRTYSR